MCWSRPAALEGCWCRGGAVAFPRAAAPPWPCRGRAAWPRAGLVPALGLPAVGPRGLVAAARPSPRSSAPRSSPPVLFCPSNARAFALAEAKAWTLPLAITL